MTIDILQKRSNFGNNNNKNTGTRDDDLSSKNTFHTFSKSLGFEELGLLENPCANGAPREKMREREKTNLCKRTRKKRKAVSASGFLN